MKQLLLILFIVLCFWSVTITIRATFLILTKDFKGSKLTWILIVMIGFVGPILWVIKGKKLIS